MENAKVRKAAVAGKFYPSDKDELVAIIRRVEHKERENINFSLANKQIIGGIVPHAGYVFSAYQAVHFFKLIASQPEKYDTIFIINPNHTGIGNWISLEEHTHWESPLGLVEIDADFMPLLNFPNNANAHKYEHSGEVMLPFLQYYLPYKFKIVPITMGEQTFENAKELANQIFDANKKLKKNILLIASSDFSHFESINEGFRKDQLVVNQILNQNTQQIENVVNDNHISVCGYGTIMALLEYAKLCTQTPKVELLARGHSGLVHQSLEVVDYISFLIFNE